MRPDERPIQAKMNCSLHSLGDLHVISYSLAWADLGPKGALCRSGTNANTTLLVAATEAAEKHDIAGPRQSR